MDQLKCIFAETQDWSWEDKQVQDQLRFQIISGLGLLARWKKTFKTKGKKGKKGPAAEALKADRIYIRNKAARYYNMFMEEIVGNPPASVDDPPPKATVPPKAPASITTPETGPDEDTPVSPDSDIPQEGVRTRRPPARLIDELITETSGSSATPKRPPHSVPYSHCLEAFKEADFTIPDLEKVVDLSSQIASIMYKHNMTQKDLMREWRWPVPFPVDPTRQLFFMVVEPDLTNQPPMDYTLEDARLDEGLVLRPPNDLV